MTDLTTLFPGKPTDLHAPGALEELFAWHRLVAGGWTMKDDEGDGEGEGGDGDEGADGDGSGDGDGDGSGDADEGADEGADELGDKGKQALDRMKARYKTTKSELAQFKALGLTPDQIKALQKKPTKKGADAGDDELDVNEIREQARAEARKETLRERAEDKIEARAAKKFADPEDAVALLMRKHKIDEFLDGDGIDAEAIQEALDELLEDKPHLAAQGGRRFKGGADGGARKGTRKKQLTRADLKGMTPTEINQAVREGRVQDLVKPT